MTLRVNVGDVPLLADVGFGGEGPILPVPFDGTEARQYAWTYRLVADAGAHRLQSRRGATGGRISTSLRRSRSFRSTTRSPITTRRHIPPPASRSRSRRSASRRKARRILRNRDYAVDRGAEIDTRVLADDDELLAVLAADFGLVFPAGTRFAYDPSDS